MEPGLELGGGTGEGVFELLVEGGEGVAEIGEGVFAEGGIGDLGAEELELFGEVLWVGGAGEGEAVVADGELAAEGFAGEDALEFFGVVFAYAAAVDDGAGEVLEAWLTAREGEESVTEAGAELDGIFLEVGFFEIYANVVGESDLLDAEGVDGFGGDGLSAGAEVGVCEGRGGLFFWRGDGLL